MPNRLLIAGIDFGTSFTKVVIRDNNTLGMAAIVVTNAQFPDGLIPSLIGIGANGLSVPPDPMEGEPIPFPKMLADHVAGGSPLKDCPFLIPQLLIDHATRFGDDRRMVRNVIAFYFAWLIRNIEAFIRSEGSPWKDFQFDSQDQSDVLVYQIAVPTGMMDPIGGCELLFREALIAAHRLRTHKILNENSVSVDEWCRLVDATLDMSPEASKSYTWQCLVYPETAAAVQAYFRSPTAGTGLYITMDVGGGTVDINAFRRQENLRDSDYYASIVGPFGAENLTKRLNIRGTTGENSVMKQLRESVRALFYLALRYQPNQGHELGNRTWDDATLFIFGGGSNHGAYERVFRETLQNAGIQKPNIMPLPGAADLTRPPKVDFGRFAVAYGMAFFKPNLDAIRLPHELAPFHTLYPRLHEEPRPPYGFNWDD